MANYIEGEDHGVRSSILTAETIAPGMGFQPTSALGCLWALIWLSNLCRRLPAISTEILALCAGRTSKSTGQELPVWQAILPQPAGPLLAAKQQGEARHCQLHLEICQ